MVPFEFHGNYGRIFSRFDTIHERDRQTPHDGIGRAYAQHHVAIRLRCYPRTCRGGLGLSTTFGLGRTF